MAIKQRELKDDCRSITGLYNTLDLWWWIIDQSSRTRMRGPHRHGMRAYSAYLPSQRRSPNTESRSLVAMPDQEMSYTSLTTVEGLLSIHEFRAQQHIGAFAVDPARISSADDGDANVLKTMVLDERGVLWLDISAFAFRERARATSGVAY